MRAAIYCRFSSDLQKPTSLADQERICRQYIEQQGWTTVEVYADAAISGSHDHRPGYQRMLNDARRGVFQVLVAEDLDRLNRRLEHSANLYSRLEFVGIDIHALTHGKIGDLHVGISGLLGEMFIKNLAQKTRRGLEGRVRAGKSGGGRCYGYDVVLGSDGSGQSVTGERRVNEAEAEVVREIFRCFATGEGPRAVARRLNERGVPGPYGHPWGFIAVVWCGADSALSRTRQPAGGSPASTRRGARSLSTCRTCRSSMISFGTPSNAAKPRCRGR